MIFTELDSIDRDGAEVITLPCGAGNAVPREGFDLSVIILTSLLVFPMLGCRHSLLRL